MNVKAISSNVGRALLVSALFMFVSMLVSLVYGMDAGFGPLLISFIITAIFGSFPFIFVKGSLEVSQRDGFFTIVLSWLLSFIFGMLPYVLYGGEFTLINAWYESVAGYTTTGSTILTDIEALPKSLLFWRSSTHFIGGLGVVVYLLVILPDDSPFRLKLSQMEISSLSREGYHYKSSKLVRIIFYVYFGLTIVATLLYWLAGMSMFDAINHAFSVVSTGGFSTKNSSIASFGSPVIDVISLILMIIAGMHFGLIYSVIATRSFKPLKNSVFLYYIGSLAMMSLLVFINLMVKGGYSDWALALKDAAFNVASYSSTTGFACTDNANWPMFSGAVLMFACFQCACSGSTTGGVKIDRMLIFWKSIGREIKSKLHPTLVVPVRINKRPIAEKMVYTSLNYITLYVVLLLISALALLLSGMDANDAISGTFACLGNCGPGLGNLIGSQGNFDSFNVLQKFVFTIDMFLGRIEIYPFLLVLAMMFKKEV